MMMPRLLLSYSFNLFKAPLRGHSQRVDAPQYQSRVLFLHRFSDDSMVPAASQAIWLQGPMSSLDLSPQHQTYSSKCAGNISICLSHSYAIHSHWNLPAFSQFCSSAWSLELVTLTVPHPHAQLFWSPIRPLSNSSSSLPLLQSYWLHHLFLGHYIRLLTCFSASHLPSKLVF